jgi:galactose oxidase-like protein/Kelch motif protein
MTNLLSLRDARCLRVGIRWVHGGRPQPSPGNFPDFPKVGHKRILRCAQKGEFMKQLTSIKVSTWLGLVVLFFGASLQVRANSWSNTGSMEQARATFTATLLNSGEVLVVGGTYRGTSVTYGLTSAELYNSSSGAFSTTGSLNTGRFGHTATLLNNGKVLIVGGVHINTRLSSAELYDPSTGKFTITGSLPSARASFSATLLNDGMVLIAGGYDGTTVLSGAELYDPSTGTFKPTGSLNTARAGQSATLLGDGKVLIAGGGKNTSSISDAELYDPSTGTFSVTGSMHTARGTHSATLLNSGEVLVAAGQGNGNDGGYLASAELYNPATGKFTTTGSLNTPRYLFTSQLLPSGEVLIVAGNHFGSIASVEIYDPFHGTFTNTASFGIPSQTLASVLLKNGEVLAMGGYESSNRKWLANAETFQ